MLLLERCDCDLGSLIYPKAGSEEEGQLSAPLMMKIATEMADGLAYLHSRGIKHLDMKPGNVLMVREGKEEGGAHRLASFPTLISYSEYVIIGRVADECIIKRPPQSRPWT